MLISELEAQLRVIKETHGDQEIYIGDSYHGYPLAHYACGVVYRDNIVLDTSGSGNPTEKGVVLYC